MGWGTSKGEWGGLGRHLGSQPVLNVESFGGEQEVTLHRQDYGRIYCAYASQSPLKHLVIRQSLQIFNRRVSNSKSHMS